MRKNKILQTIFSGLLPLILLIEVAAPVTVFAVSYQPEIFHRHGEQETFFRGDIVYLFQSGTADVRNAIHVNDVLTVYRTDSACRVAEVGKIRILSYVRDTYLKGEVVEGQLRRDDIAKKDKVSCLVISAGSCNHESQ
jgi:hypothetical protein